MDTEREATLLDHVRRHAERAPDAIAVSSGAPQGWTSVSWSRLRELAETVAGRTQVLPAGAGPVVVVVDNTVECVAVLIGLAAAGIELLLVEWPNSYLGDEASAVVAAAPRCVIGPADFAEQVSDRLRYMEFRTLTTGPATARPESAPPASIDQLTSGSTGEQRIARHRADNIVRGGRIYRDIHRLTTDDTVFVSIPLAHSFGLVGGLAAAVVSGARLLTLTQFNLRVLLAGLSDATVLLGTPLGYELIASAPGSGGNRLRVALSSGGPLSERVATAAGQRLGVRVHQIYGSTETGLVACTYERPEPWPEGSVGTFAPGVEWRVEAPAPTEIADDGAIAEPGSPAADAKVDGTVGRLRVRTGTMFDGFDKPGEHHDDNGFHDTGDLVRVDEHGNLFVLARKDTFINVGGRKINPRRVERLIGECPDVSEIFVYGGGEDDAEQEIHAAVVLAGDADLEQVVGFCRTRLLPYEIPHQVHVVAELPRSALGKVSLGQLLRGTAVDRRAAAAPDLSEGGI
ncbi:class I adenylate-forming enzyme family protein [Nocardia sp. NPDC020380]|uniref:class I adenylate-forming enzyme family protein n=1 Tax=Nocardia sp. NPDC020380 TaxID=3364309 RepID=UPI0037A26E73